MKIKNMFEPICILYVYVPIFFSLLFLFYCYTRVKAEITMCKVYYSEVSTWDCYWMPKSLPVRTSK